MYLPMPGTSERTTSMPFLRRYWKPKMPGSNPIWKQQSLLIQNTNRHSATTFQIARISDRQPSRWRSRE